MENTLLLFLLFFSTVFHAQMTGPGWVKNELTKSGVFDSPSYEFTKEYTKDTAEWSQSGYTWIEQEATVSNEEKKIITSLPGNAVAYFVNAIGPNGLIFSSPMKVGDYNPTKTQESTSDRSKYYPEFSWETVPVAFHFGKTSALLTEEEAKFVASKFNFICLEKGQAQGQFSSTEEGIKHFGHFNSGTKESTLLDIREMEKAGKAGKIVVFKAWSGFAWIDKKAMEKPLDQKRKIAERNIEFPLAAFLVGAQKNCYFIYNWGCRMNMGCLEWYPELDKKLGKPLADATQSGWTLRREFEHASVWVNLETKTANINWNE